MKNNEMTYEKAMKRLEEIVDKVENGQMDIDSIFLFPFCMTEAL